MPRERSLGSLVRPMLYAALAIAGSIYALVRYYAHARQPAPPMPPAAEDAGEIPAPELVPLSD